MKIKLLLFIFSLCFFVACEDSAPSLNLDKDSIEVDGQANTVKINVTSDSEWTVTSSAIWCTTGTTKASKNIQVTLTIKGNTESNSRTATVVFKAGKTSKTFTVTQGPRIDTENYHYKLPVVFHVLYSDQSDAKQYPAASQFATIIEKVNAHYKAKTAPVSPDMNLEFVLATTDPDGNTLAEAGVHRMRVANGTIDCEVFMNGKDPNNTTYVDNCWDRNKYINIFLYTFTNANILGIAHIPYAPINKPLEGLYSSDKYFTELPTHPRSVSINNSYIDKVVNSPTNYSSVDVVVTLSHELGHYLGLHHAFSEDDKNNDLCEDTDYCADTPTYNPYLYNLWTNQYIKENILDKGRNSLSWDDLKKLVIKTDCSGTEFEAHNIMDYAYCWGDQFTNDQRKRIRFVLANSPMIPGPKDTRTTRTIDNVVPPIIYKICSKDMHIH